MIINLSTYFVNRQMEFFSARGKKRNRCGENGGWVGGGVARGGWVRQRRQRSARGWGTRYAEGCGGTGARQRRRSGAPLPAARTGGERTKAGAAHTGGALERKEEENQALFFRRLSNLMARRVPTAWKICTRTISSTTAIIMTRYL